MADLTPQAFAEKWGKSKLSERSSYTQHFLDLCDMLGAPATAIGPALAGDIDLSSALRLRENLEICFMGPSPKAPFDIDEEVAKEMLSVPLNVNGRPNSDVVRPVASAVDIVRRSRRK